MTPTEEQIAITHLTRAVSFNRYLVSQNTIFWDCVHDLAALHGLKIGAKNEVPDQLGSVVSEFGPLFRIRLAVPRCSLADNAASDLLHRHEYLVRTFHEIAERNVSITDEYGDEDWPALDRELRRVSEKIAVREGLATDAIKVLLRDDVDPAVRHLRMDQLMVRDNSYAVLIHYQAMNLLRREFVTRHEESRDRADPRTYFDNFTGTEFEGFITGRLARSGFENVRGTATSGDQGADVLAERNGRILVVQAKRYRGPVGNRAVQEVLGALAYYGGTEAWVVTNSTFTRSARALAQKALVGLIDGSRLSSLHDIMANPMTRPAAPVRTRMRRDPADP